MGVEIERKFLVRDAAWRKEAVAESTIRQGYLSVEPERTVRVRLADERGFFTVKGLSRGQARAEYEYPIPAQDAQEMLDRLCLRPLIEKIRYRVPHGGLMWEVDVFFGDNEGLVVAEVELTEEGQAVDLPAWAGREVTEDRRYYNASLIQHPFSTWTR